MARRGDWRWSQCGGGSSPSHALHDVGNGTGLGCRIHVHAKRYGKAVGIRLREGHFLHIKKIVKWVLGLGGRLRQLQTWQIQIDTLNNLVVDGVFVFISFESNTQFLRSTQALTDPRGLVVMRHDLEHWDKGMDCYRIRTPRMVENSVPGIFAAGVVGWGGSTKQVAAPTLAIREHLKQV